MKAFTKAECIRINGYLIQMKNEIAKQENDFVRMSGVRALIDGIMIEFFDADVDDLPMAFTDGELMTLVMLYEHVNKYRRAIMDMVWEVMFRYMHKYN